MVKLGYFAADLGHVGVQTCDLTQEFHKPLFGVCTQNSDSVSSTLRGLPPCGVAREYGSRKLVWRGLHVDCLLEFLLGELASLGLGLTVIGSSPAS